MVEISERKETLRRAFESRNQIRLKAIADGPESWQVKLVDMDSGKVIPIRKITVTYDMTSHDGFAVAVVELLLFAIDLDLAGDKDVETER